MGLAAINPEFRTMNDWIVIARLEDIPRLGSRTVVTDTLTIALFRTRDDRVFALKDSCPHRGGPLSQGIVHGTTVTCPLHNWQIDLASGRVLGPDEGCVHAFGVKVEEGLVHLSLTADRTAA